MSQTSSDQFDDVLALRPELHAHCYRMLGSAHDAEDALQEALLRAWRGIDRFEGRSSLRSWLYTVVTRTCLDLIDGRDKRALPVDLGPASNRTVLDDLPLTDVAWLGPYHATTLGDVPASPGARYEQREAVELAFVAALQHLPGNQLAALLLFDVLGLTVAEIASIMDTSPTSVNSALARARRIVADKIPPSSQQQTLRKIGDARLRDVATGFAAAFERRDVNGLIALLTTDVTWSMPPLPHWYQGIEAVTDFVNALPLGSCGGWRCLVTSANGQAATASYLWDEQARAYLPWSVNVLNLRDDQICAVTSFLDTKHFSLFGLPETLPAQVELKALAGDGPAG